MTEQQISERNAKRFWVSLVILLLGLQLVIGGVAIRLAIADPSVAVVPDYHKAALDWDADRESRMVLQNLGWHVTIQASDVVDASGQRVIRFVMSDHNDQGITGLDVSAKAFHHARGGDIVSLTLDDLDDGTYQAIGTLDRKGLWELDFSVAIDDKIARVVRTLELQ